MIVFPRVMLSLSVDQYIIPAVLNKAIVYTFLPASAHYGINLAEI